MRTFPLFPSLINQPALVARYSEFKVLQETESDPPSLCDPFTKRWALKKTVSNNEKSIISHNQAFYACTASFISKYFYTYCLLDWTKQRGNIHKANVGE